MGKRGQIIGMPIVYISVVIVMGLVLYFGFNSLVKLNYAKDVTQVSKFVLDLEDDVEVVYNYDVGSSKKFRSIALPQKVTHICFYDASKSMTLNVYDLSILDSELYYYLDVTMKDNLFFL